MVARKNNIIATIKKNNVVKHQSANIVCFFLTCSVSVFFVGVATVDLERHGVPHVDTYLQTTTATDHIAHLCTMCIYTYIHGGKHSFILGLEITPIFQIQTLHVLIYYTCTQLIGFQTSRCAVSKFHLKKQKTRLLW